MKAEFTNKKVLETLEKAAGSSILINLMKNELFLLLQRLIKY
jgi:hypothetical protein